MKNCFGLNHTHTPLKTIMFKLGRIIINDKILSPNIYNTTVYFYQKILKQENVNIKNKYTDYQIIARINYECALINQIKKSCGRGQQK